ncbi:MAG: anthranilate phosphoribosyltransferase [Candidatus Omnitrophica bacterium]|nr:anthranilate phosphoribosyltransferase [Candidatus Omnitrophota bacterium]
MRQVIEKLQNKSNLNRGEIQAVMAEIMSGGASELDMKDFLLAMNTKGPTIEEISGAALIMRKFVVPVMTRHERVFDIVGTGGDGRNTFNISTCAAFVVAGSGVVVAKHGNRSVSSLCGSADVLEAMGIKIDIPHEKLSVCLDEVGLAFLFAQRHHPAMKHVAAVRKALGVKTIFNILGPLTNPAHATHQMMGVYSRHLVEQMVHVLKNLGSKRALVVHSADGLDEISTLDKTFISEFDGTEIRSYEILPEEFGFRRAFEQDIRGGDKDQNAKIMEDVLRGDKGPKRNIVLLNAAFALYAADAVKTPEEGLRMAAATIDDGSAYQVLQKLRDFTNCE